MKPKVSVIVPIYNAEEYLAQCIESVLAQTLKEIELILIDDGSTDESLKICNAYSETDNRIQVFSNRNVGQGLERNFGVKKATGEYISFLDSDDQYKKDMLEKLYKKAVEINADMVSGGYADICNGNLIKEHPLDNEILDSNVKIKEAMSNLISYEKKDGYAGCIAVWDSIFRRDLLVEKDIQFLSEREVYSEDLLYKLTVMSYSKKIAFYSDIVYLYRVNDNSFTNHINQSVLSRILELYDVINIKFGSFLEEFNLKNRIINRTFFTLRFNIKKVSKSREAKVFYKMILDNERLMEIIRLYKPTNLKNFVIYWLLRGRVLGILRILVKKN
ncbi:glycosyltransferase family 2 protein [Faecalimonas umbilicata]|uniref:glycosyltransferase family 2 protein n=1 Tax=Faecalimonas umbilicata TaxID=1912855 RepID=UPI00034E4FBB|nr:hypothetical protein HMPREF1215_01160 [Coprococcus sp. HPP0074]